MKVIFAGTPEFAVPALQAIIDAGHEVVQVLTQPDRPAGRGMKLKPSPVKALALNHQIPVYQPESLRTVEAQSLLAACDVMVVAAYGLILPQATLDWPKYGCYNIHASLLPRWRGAAPIQRAMLAGDPETGVTIMEVVKALDAGGMLKRGSVPITEQDTAETLHDALAIMGAQLMTETLTDLAKTGQPNPETQDESLVTYAAKLEKSEARIDWQLQAAEVARRIRAYNPFPVAYSEFNQEVWRIWFAEARASHGNPGEIIAIEPEAIIVACKTGAIAIRSLQKPGGKKLSARELLAGTPLAIGMHFDA
jgi:methionyl-tRNA formyltransferase